MQVKQGSCQAPISRLSKIRGFSRRGQFYIIAAAIIILIILGLIGVVNRAAVQPKPVGFFDLSKDYEAETSKVIDYGVYNKYSPSVNITEKVQNISAIFAKSAFAKDPNVHLVFIYGNKNNYIAQNISSITSTTSIGLTKQDVASVETKQQIVEIKSGSGGSVNVSVAGSLYQFNLGDQENFYFVIETTSPTGERNIAVRG